MNNIGRSILKGIHHNTWIKIEYRNMSQDITHYMIGINDINPLKKYIFCDAFNINYGSEIKEIKIYYDSIISASVCDGTYHKTPDKLINRIEEEKEEFIFLNIMETNEDVLDYYSHCFKLDTVPYITKYELVKGIDGEELDKNDIYELNEEQFKIFAENAFFQEENKKRKTSKGLEKYSVNLVVNNLSILTEKGLYVLAYQNLLLDIANKRLIPSPQVHINKEFCYDGEKKELIYVESIHKFLAEEDTYLLQDIKANLKKIIKAIMKYNKTRVSSYKNELKTDSRPFILNLGTKMSVDIDKEFLGIREMIKNPENMTYPIKTFFGTSNLKFKRALNYPIFTIDEKYNIDQISAINIGLKSPVSYIQGPPGTGKTQTLLNAILSAMFNGKTVLVSSNNNVPIDGVYEDILSLKYPIDSNEQLLFPAIRLGSFENCGIAIDTIKRMYEKACKLTPDDSKIKMLKKKRSEDMKDLMKLLSNYEKLTELKDKEEGLEKLLKDSDSILNVVIEAQLNNVRSDIEKLGHFDIEKLRDYVNIDQKTLRMAIHYETAARLQNLSKSKHKELIEIIYLPTNNKENYQERTKKFRKYLSDDENFQKFLDVFPVVLATNLSCTYFGSASAQFDIVMIDEAGQCNVANALIPIVRGKQLMLVGDPQQLKPVVVLDDSINQSLKEKYHISDEYDYVNNSIYTLFTQIDLTSNETLLSYHYRCNDKIIGFSNKKYYHSKLKLRGNNKETKPLVFVDTSKKDRLKYFGKKNVSEAEAKYICEFIKQNPESSVGIITPFVHQKECIEYYLKQNNIKDITVGTVHAFQGDQKDVILFSTAITNSTLEGTYGWLKNNKELINVAVSRPKNKLVILGNLKAVNKLSKENDDLKELIDYVRKDGESVVTDVSIESIALGTRQMSTESEKQLTETIKHILSVINNNCFVKNEVPVSAIFTNENIDSSLFYKQKFDLVVFEPTFDGERVLLAIELNGPEHNSDEYVIKRDKKKKEFCEKHNLEVLCIPRDCARDYLNIKESLVSLMSVRK